MQRNAKKIRFLPLAMILLLTVLMQNTCSVLDEEYVSRKDFINIMKGKYYINDIRFTSSEPTLQIDIHDHPFGSLDSIEYRVNGSQRPLLYSTTDPIICTLPILENVQYWTITENKSDLFLETVDLCGVTQNYIIKYENYAYYNHDVSEAIEADIILLGLDTTLSLAQFEIYSGGGMHFGRDASGSGHLDFRLRRL
jgi:hypothetical protein